MKVPKIAIIKERKLVRMFGYLERDWSVVPAPFGFYNNLLEND